jgi:hypothetical protein
VALSLEPSWAYLFQVFGISLFGFLVDAIFARRHALFFGSIPQARMRSDYSAAPDSGQYDVSPCCCRQ